MSKYRIKTELIVDYMKKNKITKQQFSKMSKMSTQTLNKILRGQTNVEIVFVLRIAKV